MNSLPLYKLYGAFYSLFIMNLAKITASQLAAISRTSERPISERLHQLEHSKDENVSLQSISALRSSLRVHLPHPRPLISLPDKLDYVRSAYILYSRSLSFTQNWIIIFGYVRANFIKILYLKICVDNILCT